MIAFAAKVQEGRNQLLLDVVDCSELEAFRAGTRQEFDHHGLILAIMQDGVVRRVTGVARAEFLDMAAASMPAVDPAAINAELRDRVAASGATLTPGELKPLGMLDRDANGLYAGFVIGATDSAPAKLTVMGLTLVDEIPVAIYLYAPLAGTDVGALLAAQKTNLKDFVAANVGAEPTERSDGIVAFALRAAVVVLVGIAVVILVRRRLRPDPGG
jgi:hypothetical protein